MAVFTLTAGVDNFNGTAGQDNTFQFTQSTLQSTDTVTGVAAGAFIDILSLTAAGTILGPQFSGVTNVERLVLPDGTNNVTLNNGLVNGTNLAGGFFQVVGGSGGDTIDGSIVNNGKRLDLFGAGGGDVLLGGFGDDFLNGGAGVDTMTGGAGNDQYFVDNVTDGVFESAGGGNDIVNASVSYTLPANVDSVVLIAGAGNINAAGNGDANALIGNSGDNNLDGKAGADYMVGGLGNDIYFVDNFGDTVVENAGEGNDIVYALIDYTLGANVDSVVLQGVANINAAGNGDVNALVGNSGNNALDGKGGADYMVGGLGNDTYYVDNPGDQVVENAGEGNDVVYSSIHYTLAANVESVVLQGAANLNAIGNGDDNALIGNSGNNILNGMGGNDYMVGGLGNDTYFVDSAADGVVENPGEGTDTVNSSISYTLAPDLENLNLLDAGGAINGTGNAGANIINGNSSDNIIDGAGGADVMSGLGGNDDFRVFDDSVAGVNSFASINGGAGLLDRITLTGATNVFNLSANASKITNVEVISMTATVGTLSLAAADIAQINSVGNSLYVLGASDDQVTVTDPPGTWVSMGGGVTNPGLPGFTFDHYHNTGNGSDLFVDTTINILISINVNNAPDVELDGAPDGLVLPDGPDHAAAYTTGNASGVAISDTDATVDDQDTTDTPGISSQIASLDAVLTDPHSGALEFLHITTAGHTIATNNSLSITGEDSASLHVTGSAADTVYQDLLKEIRYVNNDTAVALNTSDRHVTVKVNDGFDDSPIRTATIAITRGNHDPEITSADSASVNEGATAVTTVTATDLDAGTSFTYSIVPGDDGGLFGIDGSGNLTFNSPPNFETPTDIGANNVYDVTVKVSDGVSFDTQLIHVTVGDVAPSAPSDNDGAANNVAPGAATGTPVHVTALSTDPAGGPIFYGLTNDDSGGAFQIDSTSGIVTVLNGGLIVSGSYHIKVQAFDGTLTSATDTEFTINVVTNNPPVANDDTASATEAGGVNNALAGVDPSGNVILGTGSAGAVADTDVEDPSSALTVVAVGTGAEGSADNGTLGGAGFAGLYGTLTLGSTGAYTYVVNQANATVQGLHGFPDTVQDVFHYTIQDSGAASDATGVNATNSVATFTITIHGQNDKPDAVDDPASMGENDAATIFPVLDNDQKDPDSTATNSIATGVVTASGPAGLGIDAADVTVAVTGAAPTQQIQVTLGADFQKLSSTETATITVPYTLTGDAGDTDTATLTVTVNGANDAPTANNDSLSATEAGGVNNAIAGVNPSGNVITATGSAGAVADTDPDTHDTLTVSAVGTLAEGNTDNGTVNNPLPGSYGTLTLLTGGGYTYVVDQNNALVNALLPASTPLQDVFHYTISDGHGGTDSATFTVTINGANDLPDAVADTGTMGEDDSATIFPVLPNDAKDPDTNATNAVTLGPSPITVVGNGTAAGIVDAADVSVAVTGAAPTQEIQVTLLSDFQKLAVGETATVTVPYTLTGNAGETDTANLVVTVNGANDGVTANDDSGAGFTTNEDAVNPTFDVRLNDVKDPDHTATNFVTINAGTLAASGPAADGIDAADVTASVTAGNQIQLTLGADFQKLGGGESATISLDYTLHGDQAGDTDTATMTVTVNGVNDAPVAANFTFNGANSATGNTALVVNDPTDGAPDPAGPQKTISGDLLAGATDIDTPSSGFTITPGTVSNASGSITYEADGDFTYLPAAGFSGPAIFSYTVNDNDPSGNAAGTGQITINVIAPKVWYVDPTNGSDATGDGTSDNPLKTFAALTTGGALDALDGDGDTIFVYNGTISGSGLVLENNQKLISQSQGLVVPDGGGGAGTVTLVTAGGSNTAISNSGATLITLAQNNTISGFDLGNSTKAITGTSFGTLTVNNTSINTNGQALDLTTGAFASGAAFTTVSSTGGTNNVSLATVTGSVDLGNGTMSGASGTSFNVSAGSVSTTYGGNISQGNNAALVNVAGAHSGTLTFNTNTLSATNGSGLQFNNADGTYNFNGTTTLNGGAAGVDIITGADGTFNFSSNTTITNPSGDAFVITNSNAAVTYHGSISDSDDFAVNINNDDGKTITFDGGNITQTGSAATGISIQNSTSTFNFNNPTIALTVNGGGAGAGVTLTNNTSGTIHFAPTAGGNGLDINTGSGAAFSATGGGTVDVTGSGNTLIAAAGTALNISNTNISASDVTFVSITSGTGAGSAGAGIIVDGTGTAGGLHVTGGAADGAGGTIQHKTGANFITTAGDDSVSASGTAGTGIFLRNTVDVQLNDIALHDFDNFAIYANNVTGFQADNLTINGVNGNNNAGGQEEASIRLDNLHTDATYVRASITNSDIGGGYVSNIYATKYTGTLDRLIVDNVQFGLVNGTGGNDNIHMEAYNTATGNITVSNSTFAGVKGDFVETIANENSKMDVVVRNNDFNNGQAITPGGGTGVSVRGDSLGTAATVTFDITGNQIDGGGANAFDTVGIFVAKGNGAGSFSGTIANNVIGPAKANANADAIFVRAAGSGSITTLIEDNSLTAYGNAGLHLQNNDGSSTMNASVFGNTETAPNSQNVYGFFADNGATGTDTSIMNLIVGSALTAAEQNTFLHNAAGIVDAEVSNINNSTTLNLSTAGSDFNGGIGTNQDKVEDIIQDDSVGSPSVDTTAGAGNSTIITANSVRLMVSPSSVYEDGSTNITYTFLRYGNTNAAQVVNFTVGGTAAAGDYTVSGATSFTVGGSGSVTFAAGSGVAKITLDPTVDATPESNETIILTLTAAAGYTVASPSAGTATIINDDGPLMAAAGGVASSGSADSGEYHLTQAQLDAVAAAAIARWEAAGITAEQDAILHKVAFTIADMDDPYIGGAGHYQVAFDTDAAGYGWYIDQTPFDDSEFGNVLAATRLQTDPADAPAGHMDLLTAVMHELGEELGLKDRYDDGSRDDLMYGYLVTGERRLPDGSDALQPQTQPGPDQGSTGDAATPAVTAAADIFVVDHVPAQAQHVAGYSAAQGDVFDFSALLPSASRSAGGLDAELVRAIEDASGTFATLQLNMGHWIDIAQIDGAHAGDAVNIVLAKHVAQIHVDVLV